MNHTELDLIVAELMFPILVKLAPTGDTIGYKEMSDLLKIENPQISEIKNITQRHIGRKLGTIWEFTKSKKCPHIGALVVSIGGECGVGISSIVKDLPKERERIKNFDWSTISLGFESYITKAKVIKNEREEKKVKYSKEEAKDLFFPYWNIIKVQDKKDLPITSDEAKEVKDAILSLIQDGMSPEEALSVELHKILSNKKTNKSENGFVYIGEYIDSDTKLPIFDQLKIGYTTNLENRAFSLSGGVAGPVAFVMKYYWEFHVGFAYMVEQHLHGRFSKYRKNGEFFSNENSLISELTDDEITKNYGELLLSSNFE